MNVSEPSLLFRDNQREPAGPLWEPEEDQEQESEGQKAILCGQCGHTLTDQNSQLEVDGSHAHTFFNPAGIIFEIGCFDGVPGCVVHGPASVEFSWFAGYAWRLALCGHCTTHLGWSFSSLDHSFYGLILKKLIFP